MAIHRKTIQKVLILQFLFSGFFTFAQQATPSSSIHQLIASRTDEIYENLISIRRDFHKHPEVSEQEVMTSKKIQDYLLAIGLEVKTNIGGYGVVGILKGAKEGKKIAWRADIDAIATNMPDVVDFSSENEGVRHICGHDAHTTIALGIANVLASQKDHLKGTIYFIFQPSEEIAKGAKMMIADGLFDIITPDEIYALHMSPFPVGTIATKSVNLFSHITTIEIKYKASTNQDAITTFTKELLSKSQTHAPNTQFWDFNNVFNPDLGVTNKNTIYSDYIALMSDFDIKKSDDMLKVRVAVTASNEAELEAYLATINREIATSKYSEALLSANYNFQEDMPVMFTPMNNEKLTLKTSKSISNIYGAQNVLPLHGVGPFLYSDDFAYFQKSVPGVYFFLGGSNYEKGMVAMPHTPTFAIDEESIRTGVMYFSSMLIERLHDATH